MSSTIGLPLVAKPIDNTSSCGVEIISTNEALLNFCKQNQDKNNFEFEEYIEGILYHCDSIIYQEKIIYTQMGEGSYPCFDITRGKNIGTCMVPEYSNLYKNIVEFNCKVLHALTVPDGATHTEIFKKSNGELVFLEMSARPPGGHIRWMYMNYDGVDIEEAHFKIRMGLSYQLKRKPSGHHAAFMFFPTRNGKVTHINPLPIICDHESYWNIEIGQQLQDAENLAVKKAGGVCLKGPYSQVKFDFDRLKDFIPFEVEEVFGPKAK